MNLYVRDSEGSESASSDSEDAFRHVLSIMVPLCEFLFYAYISAEVIYEIVSELNSFLSIKFNYYQNRLHEFIVQSN